MDKLQYIVLITNDFEKSKAFYTEKLGFVVDHEVPEEGYAQFKLGDLLIAIFSRTEMEKVLDKKYLGTPGSFLLTFAEVEDVGKTVENLRKKGVEIIKEPKLQPWGQETAYFTDPDGHIWEIQRWVK